jgi:hypothetical protein
VRRKARRQVSCWPLLSPVCSHMVCNAPAHGAGRAAELPPLHTTESTSRFITSVLASLNAVPGATSHKTARNEGKRLYPQAGEFAGELRPVRSDQAGGTSSWELHVTLMLVFQERLPVLSPFVLAGSPWYC